VQLALGEHVVVAEDLDVAGSISHGSASGRLREVRQPALLGLGVPVRE
jgi:hypothetical protein